MNWKLVLALLLAWGSLPVFAQQDADLPVWENDRLFLKTHLNSGIELPAVSSTDEIVSLRSFPQLQTLAQKYGLQSLRKPFKTQDIHLQHTYEIVFNPGEDLWDFIHDLNQISWVEFAEAIPVYYLQHTPDDLKNIQWSLAKVEAEKAWDISKGDAKVVVAIVDDAVRMSHEDLQSRIWTNPGEIAGDSIDNDGNGFIDDINGFDVADDDNDPSPPPGASNGLFSHGTHVAGIAGAATNNGTGGASIGYNVSIMPIKTKHDTTIGSINLDRTYEGVDYAIATNADVVNMSYGGQGFSQTYQSLFTAGHAKGVTFVAACGNNGAYLAFYPANYNHVISVGSTDADDRKSGFSNYHFFVDVMAPGAGIWNTLAGSDASYGYQTGTSMSSPLVAGLAGLLISIDSTLTPDEVEACLESGCENIDALNQNYLGRIGAGRINALYSAQCVAFGTGGPQPSDLGMTIHGPYPNPASGPVSLSAHFPRAFPLELSIRDIQGRLVRKLYEGTVAPGEFKQVVNLDDIPASGAYLIEWKVGERRFLKKLLLP